MSMGFVRVLKCCGHNFVKNKSGKTQEDYDLELDLLLMVIPEEPGRGFFFFLGEDLNMQKTPFKGCKALGKLLELRPTSSKK